MEDRLGHPALARRRPADVRADHSARDGGTLARARRQQLAVEEQHGRRLEPGAHVVLHRRRAPCADRPRHNRRMGHDPEGVRRIRGVPRHRRARILLLRRGGHPARMLERMDCGGHRRSQEMDEGSHPARHRLSLQGDGAREQGRTRDGRRVRRSRVLRRRQALPRTAERLRARQGRVPRRIPPDRTGTRGRTRPRTLLRRASLQHVHLRTRMEAGHRPLLHARLQDARRRRVFRRDVRRTVPRVRLARKHRRNLHRPVRGRMGARQARAHVAHDGLQVQARTPDAVDGPEAQSRLRGCRRVVLPSSCGPLEGQAPRLAGHNGRQSG